MLYFPSICLASPCSQLLLDGTLQHLNFPSLLSVYFTLNYMRHMENFYFTFLYPFLHINSLVLLNLFNILVLDQNFHEFPFQK